MPERLRRITSGRKVIKEIDGLRFIAIMPVMILHMNERFLRNTEIEFANPVEQSLLHSVVLSGGVGVFIFFVISGFILSLPFASHFLRGERKPGLAKYFVRRLTRLEPPYIFWMTIFLFGFIYIKDPGLTSGFRHYIASITYTHVFWYGEWSPINPPSWTLEVEVQFYILAPFLASAFFSISNTVKRRMTIAVVISVIILAQKFIGFYDVPYYLTILGHLHLFLIGFLLADIYLCEWSVQNKKSSNAWYDLLAVVSLYMLFFPTYRPIWMIVATVFLFTFFYSVFRGYYFNRFFTNRWVMFLGSMCYTIYLVHLPLAELVILFTKNIQVTNYYSINLFVQLLVYIPFALFFSIVGFALVERPFMDREWPKNLVAVLRRKFTNS